jgi:hypothetical protein
MSTTDQALQAFNAIRDIPYRIPITPSEVDRCCSGKHILLKSELEKLGYTVRHRVCSFNWSSIDLPDQVRSVPHQDSSMHSFLEIQKEGQWIPVDATWDEAISSVLPSNTWDGKSETPVAVRIDQVFSPEESENIMTGPSGQETEHDLEVNGLFYAAFNEWLAKVRTERA